MTLNWLKTADDHTLVHTLIPRLVDRMRFEPVEMKWWIKNDQGEWVKANFYRCWPILIDVVNQLPDTEYWARSKHRVQTSQGARHIVKRLSWFWPAD